MKKNILQLHRGKMKRSYENVRATKEQKRRDENEFYRIAYESLGIGMSIALPIALGSLFGSFLDSKFNTEPRYVLLMLLLGILVSVYSFYLTLTKVNK